MSLDRCVYGVRPGKVILSCVFSYFIPFTSSLDCLLFCSFLPDAGKAKTDTGPDEARVTLGQLNRILNRLLMVFPRKELQSTSPCFPWIRANGCPRTLDSSSSPSYSLILPAALSSLASSSSSSSPSSSSLSSGSQGAQSASSYSSSSSPSSSNSLTSPQSVLFQGAVLQPKHSLRSSSGDGNGLSSVYAASDMYPKQQETDQLADQLTSGGSNRETTDEETSRQISDEISLAGNDEKSRMIEYIPISSETGPLSSSSSPSSSSSSTANSNNRDTGSSHSTADDVSRNLYESRIQLQDPEPRISQLQHNNRRQSSIDRSDRSNRGNSYKIPVAANTVTQASGKRGFDCIRKCIVEAGLHPVQCHSIC